MKLKCAMSDATGKWLPAVTWGESLGGGLNHDAAAAHALMQAIEEWLGVSTNDECAGNVVTWVKLRADEIMAEWGFDSGEDL